MAHMKQSTQRIATLGIATTLALILSYVEAILPPLSTALPGIKMGLPNILIIYCLYRLSWKDAAVVSAIRLVLVSLLFGNAMSFLYSLAGALLSLVIMSLMKKWDKFSIVVVSVAGGICHNLGQILMAILLLGVKELAYYMIVLTISGTVAGIVVGLSGALLLKYTQRIKFR